MERFFEVVLAGELAGEVEEGAAVIIGLSIEDIAIQILLKPVADGLKDEGGDEDQDNYSSGRNLIDAAEAEEKAVENSENSECGHGVDIALLEDDIDVHEAVAEDRVSPGDGDEREAEDREFHDGVGSNAQGEGNDVKQGKGEDAEDGTVAEPLHLLTEDRVFHAPVFVGEDGSTEEIVEAQEGEADTVEIPADFG